jgi:hypothetical protein
MSSATSRTRGSARPEAVAAGLVLIGSSLAASLAAPTGKGEPAIVAGRKVPDLCLIHRTTGRRCPGCGMARAFLCIWRGRLRDAHALNPVALPLFAALVTVLVRGTKAVAAEADPV